MRKKKENKKKKGIEVKVEAKYEEPQWEHSALTLKQTTQTHHHYSGLKQSSSSQALHQTHHQHHK